MSLSLGSTNVCIERAPLQLLSLCVTSLHTYLPDAEDYECCKDIHRISTRNFSDMQLKKVGNHSKLNFQHKFGLFSDLGFGGTSVAQYLC